MTKAVTIPLEEYEDLVNARRAADAEMRKAKEIMAKHHVKLDIISSYDHIFQGTSRIRETYVIGEDEMGVADAVREAVNKYKEMHASVFDEIETIRSRVHDYNRRSFVYRLFNKV